MEMVVYVYNINTWLKQEDHLKAILDTELKSALATEWNPIPKLQKTSWIFHFPDSKTSEPYGIPCVKSQLHWES